MDSIANRRVLVTDAIRTLNLGRKYPQVVSVLLLGSPGAGQEELAEKLSQQSKLAYLRLSDLQKFLSPRADFFANLDNVAQFALEVMIELTKQGYSSILDGTINSKKLRDRFARRIKKLKGTSLVIVIECDDQQNLDRIARHNRDISIGERPGHILDSQYYEYRKSQIEPPLGENRYFINCDYNEIDWTRLTNFLQVKLQG